jgi:DNA-binding NtrC family response regulator
MSRDHARVASAGPEQVEITDLGSRNGTFINGERIRSGRARERDVLGIGSMLLVLRRAPPLFRAFPGEEMPGVSYERSRLLEELELVVARGRPALLYGEVGVGKTAAARRIHDRSGRSGPFVTIGCGTLSEATLADELFGHERGAFSGAAQERAGLLASAHGGTLLLDAVDRASEAAQAALLGFLEDRTVRKLGADSARAVDALILASSTLPLPALVEAGTLRGDFASRVGHWGIEVPPLRQRPEDVPLVAAYLAERYAGQSVRFHPKLMLRLLRAIWPDNLRQLDAAVERAIVDWDGDAPVRLSEGVERLLDQPEAGRADQGPVLRVAASGRWFCPGESPQVSLDQRRSLELIVRALVAQHRERAGTARSVDELLERGWPGEQVVQSGANRVYVALTTLRKLGLRDFLNRDQAGYLLDPAAQVEIVDD